MSGWLELQRGLLADEDEGADGGGRVAPGKTTLTSRLAGRGEAFDPSGGVGFLAGHAAGAIVQRDRGDRPSSSSRPRFVLPLQLVSFGPLPDRAMAQLEHARNVYGALGITLQPISLQLPPPPRRPGPDALSDHLLDREEQRWSNADGSRPERALDQGEGARTVNGERRPPEASQELLALLHQRVRRNQIAAYWIPNGIRDAPNMPTGGANAMTYDSDYWQGVRSDEEGIVLTPEAGTDVLTHELGHILLRTGHNDQSTPEERANPDMDDSAPDPNNVMTAGRLRTGSEFTPEQVELLYRSRYLIPRGGAAPGASPPGAVQRDGAAGTSGPDVHGAAAAGVAGSGSPLPHLAAIQESFGHHDVTGVRAHVGGAAADAATAIGASAYATGDDVAFANAPDLRQAAHEAAHVVQQRGGVRLDGGVGRAGDEYERHADAVAAKVVSGESAEALLDERAHRGASGGPAVQQDLTAQEIARLRRDARWPGRFERGRWQRLSGDAQSIVIEEMDQLYGRLFTDAFYRYASGNQLRQGYFQTPRRPDGTPYPSYTGMGQMPHPREQHAFLLETHRGSEHWLHPTGLIIVISAPRDAEQTSQPSIEEERLRPIIDEARALQQRGDLEGARRVAERGVPFAMRMGQRPMMPGGRRNPVAEEFERLYLELHPERAQPAGEPSDDELIDELMRNP